MGVLRFRAQACALSVLVGSMPCSGLTLSELQDALAGWGSDAVSTKQTGGMDEIIKKLGVKNAVGFSIEEVPLPNHAAERTLLFSGCVASADICRLLPVPPPYYEPGCLA